MSFLLNVEQRIDILSAVQDMRLHERADTPTQGRGLEGLPVWREMDIKRCFFSVLEQGRLVFGGLLLYALFSGLCY